jgi:acetyl/propionyl-CoA carboxylase alpha subunit
VSRAFHVEVSGRPVALAESWTLTWIDRAAGIARLRGPGGGARTVIVEGAGSGWSVTIDGRRIGVTVRTRREQLIAEAEVASRHHGGPTQVRASLPGLVVAVSAADGAEVEEGAPLVTIEAMKMQNEVRAPRAGRVGGLSVAPGMPVATGTLLLTIE